MVKRKRDSKSARPDLSDVQSNSKASKLRISTYADVGDSEDEFHDNRDEILLEDSPSKRKRQYEDDEISLSDEEVLGYSDNDSDDYDDQTDYLEGQGSGQGTQDDDISAIGSGSELEDEERGWGSRKSDYYNTDKIETEQDALDEEEEARRIQQRQRKTLTEADFGFDEKTWRDGTDADSKSLPGAIVVEKLPPLQISEHMSDVEKLNLLKSRYPEYEPLTKELTRLQPVYEELAAQPQEDMLRFRVLSAYMGALAMYFALMTSTATEKVETSLPLTANELHKHDVIASIETWRNTWADIESMVVEPLSEESAGEEIDEAEGFETDTDLSSVVDADAQVVEANLDELPPHESAQLESRKMKLDAERAARLLKTEEALADLDSLATVTLPRVNRVSTKSRQLPNRTRVADTDDSDLGDEQPLLEHELAEKARKRKSLRFYTSQIAQKANRRTDAARTAGGDDDIPHRERLRDRQERLNREAEKRGLKGRGKDTDGFELNGDEDDEITNRERESRVLEPGEEAMEQHVRDKKNLKAQRDEAYRIAKQEGGRVVLAQQVNSINADGRRQVTYAIEKNKGLIPKRKKENKNPRVKKRKRYEDKTKKLRTMKPTYKGGEGRGGYGGELTGIKKNLIRSTKL